MSIKITWVSPDRIKQPQETSVQTIVSEVGKFVVVLKQEIITKTYWCFDEPNHSFPEIQSNMNEFIKNPLENLSIKLLKQGTPFQNKVWSELIQIPVGQVKTYTEIADKLESGARAVANACRNNPYPLLIPCHRVVAKSGIGGYMGKMEGSCVEIKKQLLRVEKQALCS